MNHQPHKTTPKLPAKRYACQLPLELASRLEALFDMHPQTPRSRVMADLLRLGLAEVQRTHAGQDPGADLAPMPVQPDPEQPIYLLTGPFAAFHKLSYQHHLALERAHAKDESPRPQGDAGYQIGCADGLE